MRLSILFCFLLGTGFLYSQDYTDTIYYKNGRVDAGLIYKETKNAIKYKYKNKKALVRKTFLNKYTIGDEQNSVASNWTSPNPVTEQNEIERQERRKNRKKENRKARVAFGAAFGVVGVGLFIVAIFIIKSFEIG